MCAVYFGSVLLEMSMTHQLKSIGREEEVLCMRARVCVCVCVCVCVRARERKRERTKEIQRGEERESGR